MNNTHILPQAYPRQRFDNPTSRYVALTLAAVFLSKLLISNVLADNVRSVSADIDRNSASAIQRRVFGVHGEMLWGNPRYGDPELVTIYDKLGFTNVRIPGGTTANFYLWKPAKFGCRDSTQIDKKSNQRISLFNDALSKKNRSYSTDDFADFIRQSGTDFSLVVNILCDSPESTREWMEAFLERNIPVRYVELGNELHYEEYKWRFPDVEDYFSAAKAHAASVREIFPDAKIGVIISNSSFRASQFPDLADMSRHRRFKRGLHFDRLAAEAQFADALILHLYSTFKPSRVQEFFDIVSEEKAYRNALSHFDERFPGTMKYLANLSADKEVWISEWGIAFFGWLRKHQKNFDASHLNAIYVANALLTMLATGDVAQANYHNLPTFWKDSGKGDDLTPVSFVARLFREPVRDAITVNPVAISGANTYIGNHPDYGTPELSEINSLFFDAGIKGYLVIVNKLDTHYLLDAITDGTGSRMKPDSFITVDADSYRDKSSWEEAPIDRSGTGTLKISLPPFSVTRVRFEPHP